MALQVFPGIIATEMTTNANISLSLGVDSRRLFYFLYDCADPWWIAFDFISVRKEVGRSLPNLFIGRLFILLL